MISIKNISVKRGHKRLVHQISADIPSRKITMIMGENGCGKSTLLAALSGELSVDRSAPSENAESGLWLNQNDLLSMPVSEQACYRAILRQKYNLTLDFYVHEVIAMGAREHLTHSQITTLIQKIAGLTHTEHLLQRVYTSLSGGEQARVQLARVFLQLWNEAGDTEQVSERLLLLDEPVASLDPYHQHYICQAIEQYLVYQNVTVILVMHDLYLATRYADYVLLLHQGKLIAHGDVCHVLNSDNICKAFQIDTCIDIKNQRPAIDPESIKIRPYEIRRSNLKRAP